MSTYESSVTSILQGVTQQHPSERLPGQLTAQVNMQADPVTKLRRRKGVLFAKAWDWADATTDNIVSWFTAISGERMHVHLNTTTGNIRLLNEALVEEASLTSTYLAGTTPDNIRAAAVGNEFFLGNTAQAPITVREGVGDDPANAGYFYVAAGAFSKEYNVTLGYPGGSMVASYTTPDGSHVGDAALATPEYIATQLYAALNATGVTDIRITGVNTAGIGNYYTATLHTNGPGLWGLDFSAAAWFADYLTPGGSGTTYLPKELSIADIANGKLALELSGWRAYGAQGATSPFSLTLDYQVKVAGSWVSTTYTTNALTFYTPATSSPTPVNTSIAVSTFTAQIPSGAGAVFSIARDGPYVFVSRSGGITANSTTGSTYMQVSKGGYVNATGDLPARLPAAANGFVMRVGSGSSPQYYKYNHSSVEWLETAAYNSPTGIVNVPVSISWNETAAAWELNSSAYEGRLAGDDDSNGLHEFMQFGITGMSSYQGRLVLMSGPLVSLSAAGRPRRFFRSTVTSLLPGDAMEIGSSMNSAAAYEWGVPFQKDLLLFSKEYQALIPSNNLAITPSTGVVVPTSGYAVDTTCAPIVVGRTLMYPNPRSEDYFGLLEMVPSSNVDSQYTSLDSTVHLPRYMPGRCRFGVSSTVASVALFGPSGDKNSLIVHEYHWDGDKKAQQAWHKWTFAYPIATAYFASSLLHLVFVQNGHVVVGTIDPRSGNQNVGGTRKSFLDLYVDTTITANTITVPAWMLAFDPTIKSKLMVVANSGTLAGDRVGASPGAGATMVTVPSWSSGSVGLGIPYYSGFIPSPPQTTDYQGAVIQDGKATLLRFLVGTKDSSDFKVTVTDRYSDEEPQDQAVLTWASPELEIGRALFSTDSANIVPCRTQMRSTSMEVYTEGAGELNITALEYVAKFTPKVKRR